MSSFPANAFWQAKIWGLLHDPALKALHNNSGRGGSGFWKELAAMQDWTARDWDPETSGKQFFEHIHLADLITSASDRGAIGAVSSAVNYSDAGLEISHLLSGEKLRLRLPEDAHQRLMQSKRSEFLENLEATLIPDAIKQETDPRKVFWWLWRCLPIATCAAFNQHESLLLMPAETRLPDSSIWNHTSLTAAMAGALAGYDITLGDIENWKQDKKSHPYLVAFSFTPVQELIKASRKMRDFWAGSWILHYLSAKVSWALSCKYGPDSFIYPNLFQQPLIDQWLLNKFPQFQEWVPHPTDRQLLTAGFPNVLILVLPKDKVQAAMQYAEETLKHEWLRIGHLVFQELTLNRRWMQKSKEFSALTEEHKTWNGWLSQQWQAYWSAVAIGKEGGEFKSVAIPEIRQAEFKQWLDQLNCAFAAGVDNKNKLFQEAELGFLREAYEHRLETQGRKFSVNVGSWWPFIFGKTRSALAAVKNSRTWELPTAFSVRSTISGLGPAVHPGPDWIPEATVKRLWQRHAGLFDGSEQLNATETVKRGLHKVLKQLVETEEDIEASYPDLTAGVAGYLKTYQHDPSHLQYFHQICQAIVKELQVKDTEVAELVEQQWGIPWVDEKAEHSIRCYHSRFLNAGWLAEEIRHPKAEHLESLVRQEQDSEIIALYNTELQELRRNYRQQIQAVLDQKYRQNNPADWYVLAAGDGDGMSEWLQGRKLKNYKDYIAPNLSMPDKQELKAAFDRFLTQQKRMGPSTHSALSRALLDFSNQLVPYLTEERYAGRLIYAGGDDIMAYTNLWEWDRWLWDVRQCFRGQPDPEQERVTSGRGSTEDQDGYFISQGDYWLWQGNASTLSSRPRFTMGSRATISFGVVIAHHSVPLAIALENLWKAEQDAKKHCSPGGNLKDAVQVKVLYGNGNTLVATTKFNGLNQWQSLIDAVPKIEPALFEQAAQVWERHPAPVKGAIHAWSEAFCDRRDAFKNNEGRLFCDKLEQFLGSLYEATDESDLNQEVTNWLKLAAFVVRKRRIKLPTEQGGQS